MVLSLVSYYFWRGVLEVSCREDFIRLYIMFGGKYGWKK